MLCGRLASMRNDNIDLMDWEQVRELIRTNDLLKQHEAMMAAEKEWKYQQNVERIAQGIEQIVEILNAKHVTKRI